MCFLMSFWFGKKSANNHNDQRLWQIIRKKLVGFGGVGGRGGVPGKRKSWGLEDCMYLLSDLARRTQGAADL